MKLRVRPETEKDLEAITTIHNMAFGQPNEAVLVEKLRRTPAFIPELSLVAEFDRIVIGHVLFYPVVIISGDNEHQTLSLAPIGVMPKSQNQGIGSALIRNGLLRATHHGHTSVIVLGHPQYYPRFGFIPASTWGIKLPFDAPDNAFLALELVDGALENRGGSVRYPDQFADV